jgi:hypothetical protein
VNTGTNTGQEPETPGKGRVSANLSRKIVWLIAFAVLLILAYVLYVQFVVKNDDALAEIFEVLEDQDYEPNFGLSTIFLPGNVIQTMELGENDQVQELDSPVIVVWGSDCFPGLQPNKSPYALPESSGTSAASLGLGAKMIAEILPSLDLESEAVSSYKLTLEDPQLLTFAKGELTDNFSEKCVEALVKAEESGDKFEWFSVIWQAVAAESIIFEVNWKSTSAINAQGSVKNKVREALGMIAAGEDQASDGEAEVTVETDTEKKTVMTAQGLVVLGYKTRSISPIYDQ